ncbi:MAG: DUF2254 domain-containing protein [Acidimicrobiia bacterium]|nr:DUF2254 domain-containing protein [Acidimicrobiia bacterium]
MAQKVWLAVTTDFHRATLWFLPALGVFGALALGSLLAQIEIETGGLLGDLIFRGNVNEARELLTVIAGTMITVTGLVFVLTVVALQIASTQFSPRLLRTFMRDRGTQVVLSTFVATFTYSLAGLHNVGRTMSTGELFLPRVAVTGALVLAFASVGMLVFYIQHISNSIRIDTIMQRVEDRTLAALDSLHPQGTDRPGPVATVPDPPANALMLTATRSGYVQEYYADRLLQRAADHNAIMTLDHPIGHHVVRGRPVARVWSLDDTSPVPTDVWAEVGIVTRAERVIERDVAFGIRQMVDIAIKAIGPSINDPYTATQAVQHLSVLLVEIAARNLQRQVLSDTQGIARVFIPVSDFANYLDLVCSHVRQEAAGRPRVMVALLRLLEDVAAITTDPAHTRAVAHQIHLILIDARREIAQEADLEELERVAAKAQAALSLP